MKKYNIRLFLLLSLFLAIYLIFPNSNSSSDAYASAAYIRYGFGLLQPFHLLYNFLGFVVHRCLSIFCDPDVLSTMKSMNAVAAVVSLLLLYRILLRLNIEIEHSMLLLSMCALSFGVLRYATENETYILPLVFSLSGSYHYLEYTRSSGKKSLVLAGFWASLACLFHIIHFLWWLGLFIGLTFREKRLKSAMLYVLPSLLVPMIFLIAVPIHQNCKLSAGCLWSFFGPVLEGDSVVYRIGVDNLYLGIISLTRTFYQVHGNMFILFGESLIFVIPAIISVSFLVFALSQMQKKKLVKLKKPSHFNGIHILIFIFQLLFAFYSKGNAEFMVMIPFLAAIFLSSFICLDSRFLFAMTASLLIWNLSYGILFSHFADFNKRERLISAILNNRKGIYILEQPAEIRNQIFYRTGIEDFPEVIGIPDTRSMLDSILLAASNDKEIFTDFYDQKKIINRYSLTKTGKQDFMFEYNCQKADSFENFYGRNYIYRIGR